MNKERILIVDDEKLIASSLAAKFHREGFEVQTAASGREALDQLHLFRPQLVMLDISLPDIDGLELLKRLKGGDEQLAVIMMTAYANVECALQALKDGADDFIGKPFCLDGVSQAVRRTLKKGSASGRSSKPAPKMRRKVGNHKFVGNSPRMIGVFKLIRAAADADAKTVLVTGESGTGKELVARAIHCHSARARAPFIEVNCASIPENLLENELFGHEKGAFTDASSRHKGVFEMAEGGTLFLDEIGDMPFLMQAKVLKAIESRRFRRLGGQQDVEAEVRIVAATHQNLPRMVAEGKFRRDLFFRLNVMHIPLPPLRERTGDIEPLVQYFLETLSAEYGRKVESVSPETLRYLTSYRWPGNVRELRNAMERLVMLEEGEVLSAEHLSPEIRGDDAGGGTDHAFGGEIIAVPGSGISLEELEKLLIVKALAKCRGNQSMAARLLKTTRDTLRYRMKKFDLVEGSPPEGELSSSVQGGPPDSGDSKR